jgi:hypothetical protein
MSYEVLILNCSILSRLLFLRNRHHISSNKRNLLTSIWHVLRLRPISYFLTLIHSNNLRRRNDDLLCPIRFVLLYNSTAQIALCLLGFLFGHRLTVQLCLLHLLIESSVHLINLCDAGVYLFNRNFTHIILVDDSEHRLILLLINCEVFLHFLGCFRQETQGYFFLLALVL